MLQAEEGKPREFQLLYFRLKDFKHFFELANGAGKTTKNLAINRSDNTGRTLEKSAESSSAASNR